MTKPPRTALVAVGGNALIIDDDHKSIPHQAEAAARMSGTIADMVEAGWRVVVTHGNGPQVGFILRRSEIALHEVAPVPMHYATADTQGAIGYMFQRSLCNEFRRRGLARAPITLVTQVLIDRDDPAFADPSKPIGSYMDEDTAKALAVRFGWSVKNDAGRGWRRVVPSPQPQKIIELEAIHRLVDEGYVVIACGGGGIPVFTDRDGDLRGIEAVIDKDLASGKLAETLGVDVFVVSTSVARVAIHFNTPRQQWLDRVSVAQVGEHLAQGHFHEGSMAPKVRAIMSFVRRTGASGLITDPANLGKALAGRAGTWIVAS